MRTMIAICLLAAAGAAWASGGVESASPPRTAFALKGSELLYDRAGELRWSYEADVLTIQTTRETRYQVEVITPNVLRIRRGSTNQLLIRIGSPEYLAMIKYRECVLRNKGKNLFDLETCEPPFALPE